MHIKVHAEDGNICKGMESLGVYLTADLPLLPLL